MRSGPLDALERSLAAIAEQDAAVHAWAFVDPDLARRSAATALPGPLHGLTAGVKDVFDTADQPAEYGSPIYRGHRPWADAAAVALWRSAGAVIVGKTVTAELAWFSPGPTTNPRRATHTPGGSSSGSAAAVAAGMVDLALGTQTAGSVIRPASFCGVFGLKPTFGLIPTAGVKQAAPSLDTVGLFSRDLDVLELGTSVLTGRSASATGRPRFALVRTDIWDRANADCRAAIEQAAARVHAVEAELPGPLDGLADRQPVVQAYEGARALAWERAFHAGQLSDQLRSILEWGAGVDPAEYDDVCALAHREDLEAALFRSADVLVTPAAPGEAPPGLESTGDPAFCRLWTLLGYPTISVPGLTGSTGLPIGVQLVARPHHEGALLAAARQLVLALGDLS